jgi:hypothetical protein
MFVYFKSFSGTGISPPVPLDSWYDDPDWPITTCTVGQLIWGSRWPAPIEQESLLPKLTLVLFHILVHFFLLVKIHSPLKIPHVQKSVSTNVARLRTTNDVTLGMWLHFFTLNLTCLQGPHDNTIWTERQQKLSYIKTRARYFYLLQFKKSRGKGELYTTLEDITRPEILITNCNNMAGARTWMARTTIAAPVCSTEMRYS